MSLSLRLLPLGIALMLGGCQFESAIEIVQDGRTPQFRVTYDKGRVACVDGLTVTAVMGTTRKDMWAVRRTDKTTKASCRDRFTYGTVPPGYEVAVPVQALQPGEAYDVQATGVGWSASAPLPIR